MRNIHACTTALLLAIGCSQGHALDHIWIEGENPTSVPPALTGEGVDGLLAGKGWEANGWGNTNVISGAKFLHVNWNNKQVEALMPEDGVVFGYDFELASAGAQHIWARIGWEWARSDFEWRVDDGEWQLCSSTMPTVNVQPIQTWNELGWIELGAPTLSAGSHTLSFRHRKIVTTDNKGKEKTERILHGLDAICITAGTFMPTGKLKPDETYDTEDDLAAAKQVFTVTTEAGPDGRAWTELNGLWQYAAWEEASVSEDDRLLPVEQLDADLTSLKWRAYQVPGRRETRLPEETFAHRYLIRTKFDVPADAAGKGAFLDLQRSSMITSVFVNGVYCGHTDKAFLTACQIDISKALKPGATNDLVMVVKDAYYSLNPGTDERGNRSFWNTPRDFLHRNQGTASRMDWPVNRDPTSGLSEPASIVICGAVYADDVFPQPSVSNKQLDLEITVANPTDQAAQVVLRNRVVPWNQGQGGEVALQLPEQQVTVPAGAKEVVNLGQAWDNPTLWWPDAPHLYWVETETVIDGQVVDLKRTRFGFREWDWSTQMFKLNGINWPLFGDLSSQGGTPQSQLKWFKEKNLNHIRYWKDGGFAGYTRREAMNFYDENGIIIRSSGTLDGQIANYGGGLTEQSPTEKDERGRPIKIAKRVLWDTWHDHLTYWVKEERNHPAIHIWSVENEVTYINANNLGQWREVEPEMTKAMHILKKVDPTRPIMVDGGNALRDESLEINGGHYSERVNADFRDFPDAAYTSEHWFDPERPQRGAWRVVPGRPYHGGEIYFASGYKTDDYATIGGDQCFIGIGQTADARGIWGKILVEGYRWQDIAAYTFWKGPTGSHHYWNSWKPTAVLCRQWNWSWGAGEHITRDLRIFNHTRFDGDITATWKLELGGQVIAQGEHQASIKAGEHATFQAAFDLPVVDTLTEGRFVVTASRDGEQVYEDIDPVRVHAPKQVALASIPAGELAVVDPDGRLSAWLDSRGVAYTKASGEAIPDSATLILIGSNAIGASDAGAVMDATSDPSTSTYWYGLAAAGKRVIVLDQENPLKFRAIPADLKTTGHTGRIGFSQDLSHPIFDGLEQSDFFTWGNDHIVYRKAYKKGTKGGRSLFHCDNALGDSALFESQIEDGLLILCQLDIGNKLSQGGVAERVLANMFNYAAAYTPVRKDSRSVLPAGGPRAKLLDQLALKSEAVDDPLAALVPGQVAIIDATPANLKILADNKATVDSFCEAGGWLMVWGLGPEGLADYNRLVGYEHALRPFDQERVILNQPTDPMASGITLRDVVMDTGEKMYKWMALKKPDTDAFSYLVDHTDIAPFCQFPKPTELGKPSDDAPGIDHFPRNMVNGFTSDDNWAFTYTTIMDRGDSMRFTLKLPKEEEIVALKIRPSKIYHPITKMNIYFDDDPTPVSAEIPVKEQPVVEEIPVEGRKATTVTLEIAEWAERGDKNIVVIDNIWLQVKRSEAYMKNVSSILNVGGLMKYKIGKGGILLNQLNIKEREQNPINAEKKATITKTLLANAGAVFSGGKTVVAGANVAYTPVQIDDGLFNAYVHREGKPGWFQGDGDFKALPVGEQTFANVDFFLSDFSTSPVPSCFMLATRGADVKENEITGITIDRKADALFFLHTAQPNSETNKWDSRQHNPRDRERSGPPPVIFSYRVNYADGSNVELPVRWNQEVRGWATVEPADLPGAALAWVGELPKPRKGDQPSAAAWVMQWTNPKPDVAVKSIDIVGNEKGKYGAPAVFAITTASVQ